MSTYNTKALQHMNKQIEKIAEHIQILNIIKQTKVKITITTAVL